MIPIYRGDVVLVNFPFVQDFSKSKKRPALVIQNDVGNRFSSNTIVLSTGFDFEKARLVPSNNHG